MVPTVPTAVLAALVAVAVNARSAHGQPVRRWADTAVVESTVQEVFAHPPADMVFAATNNEPQHAGKSRHAQGAGRKRGKGYHHKHSSSGDDGYKHFDTFHTKSGDKYGYEQHSSFAKKNDSAKKKKNAKKQAGGKKRGAARDAGFAESHPDVEVVKDAAKVRQGPRSQSLQDASGDASFDHENVKYRRGLHGEDDNDMFFVFSGDGNQDDDGAQQQQQGDDDDDDEGGEASEQQQQRADDDDDDDDDDEGGQQRQQDDDYDY